MSVTVRLPSQLRTLVGGQGEITVEAATVGAAIAAVDARHPGLADRVLDPSGALRRFGERLRGRRGRALSRRTGHGP
jgi:molybdopterin converting factor small subunit